MRIILDIINYHKSLKNMANTPVSPETKTENNSSKITIIILAVLLAALAFFAYQNYQKNKESEQILLDEKLEIQSDLDDKIAELDNAIAENSSLEEELVAAKNNIIAFRDSVSNLKTLNYNIIRRYKDKLAVLEASNKKLLYMSDSLKIANYNISIERDSAQAKVQTQAVTIDLQTQKTDSLLVENTDLVEKVTIGAALQISEVATIAMKESSSGKLKETNRASRTDAFRVSFKIRANAIAETGLKKAHIVVQNATGNVLSPIGSFTDDAGVDIAFTEVTDVEYNNDDIEVITLTSVSEKDLAKGDYYVKVYLENKLLGATKIYLK